VAVPLSRPTVTVEPATSLLDEVRQVFADLTRYPLDILLADADLEEELGVDSVKLGEIFSVLRERYALPPRSELREKISADQLRSIGGITAIVRSFGNVSEVTITTPPAPVAPAPGAPVAAAPIATVAAVPTTPLAAIP